MDFVLSEPQQDLLDGLDRLLARRAGVAQARRLGGDRPSYDAEFERLFVEAGFAETALHGADARLDGALVVEACARAAVVAPIGARVLVAPGVGLDPAELAPGGPIALAVAPPGAGSSSGPVRFASDAVTLLALDGDGASIVDLSGLDVARVDARYGAPMGRLPGVQVSERHPVGPGSGDRLAAWWRVSLVAELVGTMDAAFQLALAHVRTRTQFGRSIGSFQAVQHRFAEASVLLEGSRWLGREAAWLGAPEEEAAMAIAYATSAARRVFLEVHQLTGAIGFATEHDLHIYSMRLPALVQEAASIDTWQGAGA